MNTKFVRVLGYDIRSYRSNTVLLHILCDDGTIIEHDDSLRDILRKTTPLGPRIRAVYGMPAPENTTKKR